MKMLQKTEQQLIRCKETALHHTEFLISSETEKSVEYIMNKMATSRKQYKIGRYIFM